MATTLNNLTYNGLVELIKQISTDNSENFIQNIPNFIAQAEFRCSGDCKILSSKENTTNTTLPANTFVLQKPDNWYRTLFVTALFQINNQNYEIPLINKPYASAKYLNININNQPINLIQIPKYSINTNRKYIVGYYSDDYSQTEFYFAPKWSQDISLLITYYALIRTLSEQNQQNALTQYVPDLLESAAKINAYKFISSNNLYLAEEENYQKILVRYGFTDKLRETSQYFEKG